MQRTCGRLLADGGHDVDERQAVCAEQPEHAFFAGNDKLLQLRRQLYAGIAVNLNQLIDAAEGGLLLACHEVRADAESVYRVPLAVKRQEDVLVDVVRCHYLRTRQPPAQLQLLIDRWDINAIREVEAA